MDYTTYPRAIHYYPDTSSKPWSGGCAVTPYIRSQKCRNVRRVDYPIVPITYNRLSCRICHQFVVFLDALHMRIWYVHADLSFLLFSSEVTHQNVCMSMHELCMYMYLWYVVSYTNIHTLPLSILFTQWLHFHSSLLSLIKPRHTHSIITITILYRFILSCIYWSIAIN